MKLYRATSIAWGYSNSANGFDSRNVISAPKGSMIIWMRRSQHHPSASLYLRLDSLQTIWLSDGSVKHSFEEIDV